MLYWDIVDAVVVSRLNAHTKVRARVFLTLGARRRDTIGVAALSTRVVWCDGSSRGVERKSVGSSRHVSSEAKFSQCVHV